MFEVVGQDIISGNMGFIGTDSDRLYRMGAAEKTEDVTVTGNPAVLDNATGKPFKDLHIYGRSEQMTTTGAQLFDAASIKKNDKIQVEISDNSYTIQMTTTINESGSPSNRVYIAINHVIEGDFSGKTVTLSYDGVNSDVPNERYVIGLMYNTDDGRTHYLSLQKDMPKSISVTLPENTTNLTLRLFITEFTSPTVPAGTYTVTIQGAMLTEGSEKKDWEPYTGGKPSPSPDYPQEIVSADTLVIIQGKNLWHGGDFEVLVGHSPTGFAFAPQDLADKVKALPNDTYSFSYKPIGSGNAGTNIGKVSLIQEDGLQIDLGETITLTNEVRNKIVKIGVYGYLNQTNKITKLQIERSHEPTDYEPYRIPQIFTISTNLPGIPVDSGGNYTDEQGQQWICDEVDLGRGVYRQRIEYVNVVFNKLASSATHSGYRHVATDIQNMSREHKECLCNIATYSETASNGTEGIRASGEYNTIVLYYDNLTNDNVSADVAYILSDPIETPLTASEIAAYKSLRTYRGTTIVEAEDKAGISATYKCNTKAAEKEVNILHADLMAEMEELDENSEIV